jgi:hypothetical protein
MFLTHPQQTKDNFKEVIQNLLDDCLDIENKINPELLPKTLRAKEAAWLMVCVQLGGEVDLSNDELFFLIAKKARRFHNHIHSKYYQGTEGIEQSDMTDSFAGEEMWDFTITKEAFLNYIKSKNKYCKLLTPIATIEQSTEGNKSQVVNNNNFIENHFTLSKTSVSNIFNTEISVAQTTEIKPTVTTNPIRSKSSRKDVISEALSRFILPTLEKEGHSISNGMNFIKLCWEKLPEGLKLIGCTDVKMNIHSIQDEQSFEAKHPTLLIPANNFKAFYQRFQRLIKS